MNSKTTSIVTYITIIGFIIALASGERDEKSVQHINNYINFLLFFSAPALVLCIFTIIPFIGWIIVCLAWCWSMFGFVLTIIGLVHACQDKVFVFPIVGKCRILRLPQA